MKRAFIGLLLLALFVSVPAIAESLILNGDFEQITSSGLPANWVRDLWENRAGQSQLTVVDGGFGGSAYAALVRNLQPNDARFIQEVQVQPNAYYRIRCMARAEGCDEAGAGASISIIDTWVGSDSIYDTMGDWKELTLCGLTGPDQYTLTVAARLGDYGMLSTGAAWFDGFTMEQLSKPPVGEEIYSFAPLSDDDAAYADEFGEDERQSSIGGLEQAMLIQLVALAFAGLFVVLVVMVGRGRIDLQRSSADERRLLYVGLALALGLRLVISVAVRGYEVDMTCFSAWSQKLFRGGIGNFYEPDYFCDYPPGYLYVLYVLGLLRELLRIPMGSQLEWMLLKLPAMLADMAAALLLFNMARKVVGKTTALLVAMIYAFNLMPILNSAAWGQMDSVLVLLLLLSVHFATKERWLWALPLFAVAALVKPQALMFGPLGLAAYVTSLVQNWRDPKKRYRGLLALPVMAGVVFALSAPVLTSLNPALLEPYSHWHAWLRPVGWLMGKYTDTLGSYAYLTVNACNLYTLLDMNWAPMLNLPALLRALLSGEAVQGASVGMSLLAWCLMGLSYVYSIFLYIKARDRRKLPLIAAMLLVLCFCFGAKMHERYLFPALMLLLLAYIEQMDVRLIGVFIVLSFTQFVNVALVLRSEHLIASEQVVNAGVSLLNIVTAGVLCWTSHDLCLRGRVMGITRVYQAEGRKSPAQQAVRARLLEGILRPKDYRLNLKLRDYLLMLLLSALYAALTFTNLGVTSAPQTSWISSAAGEQITMDLGSIQEFRMTYYGGICDTNFKVQFSDDGEAWSREYYADYDQGQIFRWIWYQPMVADENSADGFVPADPKYPMTTARYIRLTMVTPGLVLSEIAFIDAEGTPLPISAIKIAGGSPETGSDDTNLLLDEQDCVPAYPSYLNGTYFDEIYHARTAYEHIHGLGAYEYTHPPLGKLLIAVGIKMFGMTPFGWRFMGALIGVLMLPLMYLLGKQLLRRTSLAFVMSVLMALDLMHFTQTRIATIDSYAVFFIMLMYLFMFRYAQMSFFHVRLWRTLIPLGLCGLSMSLAIASKWIGIYAACGLAVLLFYTLLLRYRQYRFACQNAEEVELERPRLAQRIGKQFWRNTIITLGMCVLFFIVIPLVIYYLSYYWQMAPEGRWTVTDVWKLQKSMMGYHANISWNTHAFESPWYQWPIIGKPMFYYTGRDYLPSGLVSAISCLGNPAVWWTGLISMLFVLGRSFYWLYEAALHSGPGSDPRAGTQAPENAFDRRYVLLIVACLSQYLPWVLVPRSMFIYHYFASVPFIILATGLCLDYIRRRSVRAYRITAWALCVVALLLFGLFYPIASGLTVPHWLAQLTKWSRNWVMFS